MRSWLALASWLLSIGCGQPSSEHASTPTWRKLLHISDLRMDVTGHNTFLLPSPEFRNSILVFSEEGASQRLSLSRKDAEVLAVKASKDATTLAIEYTLPESARGDDTPFALICVVDRANLRGRVIPWEREDLRLVALSADGDRLAYFVREPRASRAHRLHVMELGAGATAVLTDPFSWPGEGAFVDNSNIAFAAWEPLALRRTYGQELWIDKAEPPGKDQYNRTHTFIQSVVAPKVTRQLDEITILPSLRRPILQGASFDGRLLFVDYEPASEGESLEVVSLSQGHLLVRTVRDRGMGRPAISHDGTLIAVPLNVPGQSRPDQSLQERQTSLLVWSQSESRVRRLPLPSVVAIESEVDCES